ncbi:MAG: D-alanyl-D-alanine carboxypeptidase/D-alanyl-D-alanine-endopeptidase [Runella slithyformis]|nr:MAG: D-alanyl-D-alanine carboxypeptidase/D-alanyl-D-alanine-endopeptidase [Runella slithyformis]TAE94689.1 MAG: D-alanyl-D-alanine carboxypeptidase/D-alanyl-D-alanine-endopeptidase [Runella slithyformis]TAF23844.1 MAG: D-alanyl-D-alanine carboxypeptidase/D-alanyl-D-alanine-endopeptidase [Runella slithyformis]TAF78962.1 MAG: D-alanyl-D-alanine carboxypeptidase/D-alanyl-D-alanine-endopeptidase [Runella slithyformis]
MRSLPISLWAFIICLTLAGCATSQPVLTNKWSTSVSQSPVFRQNHTGFALYDLAKQETVAEYQSDRYFTPASNTKLFTFYAGLCLLPDSVPALRYVTRGDSLLFWGTGDPSLLHPDMPSNKVIPFLKNGSKKLYFYPQNYVGERFGAGWSWSEYEEYYQAELSGLPLFGNVVRFSNKTVSPRLFRDSLQSATWREKFKISRSEYGNRFYSQGWPDKTFVEDIPYRVLPALSAQLLADTLKKPVALLPKLPAIGAFQTLYGLAADTLYRRMLQLSDNMLAEQILLMCAAQLDSSNAGFDSQKGIDYMKQKHLADLPDEPIWKDGSGLSRYNLFTPRSIVKLLQKIYEKMPQEQLFNTLAIGGKAGTIRSQYKTNEPFVFAKSGTLANNYSLSGYLRTKSNKILIFSFMNSNFTRSGGEIRREVERVLTEIREQY